MSVLNVVIAGTITGYGDLVSKVGEWLDRDDLAGTVPDFIALCEARLNRELRTVMQETRATWSITGGGHALPSDFRKMRRLWVSGSPSQQISEMSPQAAIGQYADTSGTPSAYYIEGRTLYLVPTGTVDVSATYWTRITPLTATNDSNWLMDEHPDAYLIGTLMEAAVFIRDDEAVAYLSPRFDDTIAQIKRMSRTDQYGGGPIVPSGPRQVRGGTC